MFDHSWAGLGPSVDLPTGSGSADYTYVKMKPLF